jgi:predicted AlkP superfamily pyrophosphatase or phosphodiesterase
MTNKPLVVINIVGLTHALLGEHTPNLNRLVTDGFSAILEGVFPAVTCTAQSSMLTGKLPAEHGIVANGWYFRDLAEVFFWRQSNRLVQGEKIWEAARKTKPDLSCAQLFWWYNMYANVDWSVTPRPIYPADGRKLPALYSYPQGLHESIEAHHGPFPFFNFWGPKSDIQSSQWIAHCAKQMFDEKRPDLTFVYLPHLDYNLQRLGPNDPHIWNDVQQIDEVAGKLIEHLRANGAEIILVSEYGIEQAVGHVNINRVLREAGLLRVRETLGWELLDYGASRAFAVADHQVAHVYVNNPKDIKQVAQLLAKTPGIEQVLDEEAKQQWGINHERSGELVAIAEQGHWFTYYYWLDDSKAPDFARTVDIHRKPGYDPVELFVDPDLSNPKLKVVFRLLQKRLGFRMLMDVIPLKADLVKGCHGRLAEKTEDAPLLISTIKEFACDSLPMTNIKSLILQHWGK